MYRELGCDPSKTKEDFLIVAIPTMHGLDIVYSEDKRTMISENALKSYRIVNVLHNLKTPAFKSYGEFKHDLKSKH